VRVGWREEARHGGSFSFPVNLACWWVESSISFRSCQQCCFLPWAFATLCHACRPWSARIPCLCLRRLENHRNSSDLLPEDRLFFIPQYIGLDLSLGYLKAYSRAGLKLSKQNFSHPFYPLLQNSPVQQHKSDIGCFHVGHLH